MLSHRALAANARARIGLWRWSAADVLVHALPINHVHGLFVGLHLPLLTGSTSRFLPKFDAEAVLAALRGATAMMGVPTFYTRLLDTPGRSEEHTSELQSLMRISYAVFCLKKKTQRNGQKRAHEQKETQNTLKKQ